MVEMLAEERPIREHSSMHERQIARANLVQVLDEYGADEQEEYHGEEERFFRHFSLQTRLARRATRDRRSSHCSLLKRTLLVH